MAAALAGLPQLHRRARKHPFAWPIAWLLMTFFILFPKGGIKTAGVPLTWGYLVLALTIPFRR